MIASVPLFAQMDVSGSWAARNYGDALGNRPSPGPSPVDYLGLTINDSAKPASSSLLAIADIDARSDVLAVCTCIYDDGSVWPQAVNRNGAAQRHDHGLENCPHGRTWLRLRSGWTGARTPQVAPRTRSAALPPENGKTMSSPPSPLICQAGALRRNGVVSSDRATMKLRLFRHDDIRKSQACHRPTAVRGRIC